MKRDFVGYADQPPIVPWPGGARVAVNIALNYEEGAEQSIAFGDPRDEDPVVFGSWRSSPDHRSFMKESFFEYGSRAGIWRLLRILDEAQVPATVFACGQALERNPRVGSAAAAAGHEICSHGYRWRGQIGMSVDEEREEIRRAVAAIEATSGLRPVGWYSRDGITERTRDLLVEEGFLYDSNAYSDDLPYHVPAGGGHHLVVPYCGDTNDARFWGAAGFATANDFFEVMRDSVQMLLIEGEEVPKMMSVGLHMRIGGRPGVAIALRRFIAWAKEQPGVWFATRAPLARHWIVHGPAPARNGTAPLLAAPRDH
jgi:peptidoglycan/xylan/chitin deacetylase (PgdA/CDA1 family)